MGREVRRLSLYRRLTTRGWTWEESVLRGGSRSGLCLEDRTVGGLPSTSTHVQRRKKRERRMRVLPWMWTISSCPQLRRWRSVLSRGQSVGLLNSLPVLEVPTQGKSVLHPTTPSPQ